MRWTYEQESRSISANYKTEYQTISIQELICLKFQSFSRTIRYDIDQINDYLKENHLQPLNLGKRCDHQFTEPDITARESSQKKDFTLQTYKGKSVSQQCWWSVPMITSHYYQRLRIDCCSRINSHSGFEHIKTFAERHLYVLSHSNKVASGRDR